MRSSSSDDPEHQVFRGQLVVFTGKLSSLGRKDAGMVVTRLGGALADDVNARTTMLVMGEEGFGDREKSNKLRRAEELNATGGASIAILREEEFCDRAGIPTTGRLKRQYHAMRDLVLRYPSLREDHLRYLVKCGLLRPVLRTNADVFFDFGDLTTIKQVSADLEGGRSFNGIVRAALAERLGQLAFDFRIDAAPATILALRPPTAGDDEPSVRGGVVRHGARDAALAEDLFRRASALDDGDEATQEEAATGYRRALECDPYLVPAIINLANVHYSRDQVVEAQALYERAIGLEPDFFEAHFNLGNIYHDLARFDEAEQCYLEALRLNPYYAEAHFYLAVTFEKHGRSDKARPHWLAYQQLAPQGEWVELAREFCD